MARVSGICWCGLGADAPGQLQLFPGGCAGQSAVITRAPHGPDASRHRRKLSWKRLRLRSKLSRQGISKRVGYTWNAPGLRNA
eukprot:1080937-Alexandrium_andersonii.AAC.1